MASVELEIAQRNYSVACRDGEEAHLRDLAAIVDGKAKEAAGALGTLGEARQLLFASLLLADEIKDREAAGTAPAPAAPASADGPSGPAADAAPAIAPALAAALERLADRMEGLAQRLEGGGASA